jgi:hypothetical protein
MSAVRALAGVEPPDAVGLSQRPFDSWWKRTRGSLRSCGDAAQVTLDLSCGENARLQEDWKENE